MAKRNIEVKEKALIDRLNSRVDGTADEKKTYETPKTFVWDNHGPVQFEEEDTNTPKTDNEDTQMRTPNKEKEYEYVNHPKHYNQYDVEVIDMMERIFGLYDTYAFCKLNAYKYRMRAGTKPGTTVQQDLDKEQWYLTRAENIKSRMTDTDRERATEFSKKVDNQ